jgi:hypothetical protein
MNIPELQSRYAGGATPSGIIEELWHKIEAWNDPALFIHLPRNKSCWKSRRPWKPCRAICRCGESLSW